MGQGSTVAHKEAPRKAGLCRRSVPKSRRLGFRLQQPAASRCCHWRLRFLRRLGRSPLRLSTSPTPPVETLAGPSAAPSASTLRRAASPGIPAVDGFQPQTEGACGGPGGNRTRVRTASALLHTAIAVWPAGPGHAAMATSPRNPTKQPRSRAVVWSEGPFTSAACTPYVGVPASHATRGWRPLG